jgi:hypothetical protein
VFFFISPTILHPPHHIFSIDDVLPHSGGVHKVQLATIEAYSAGEYRACHMLACTRMTGSKKKKLGQNWEISKFDGVTREAENQS